MYVDGKRYRRVSLDTAADEQPTDEERSLGRIMRSLPLSESERAFIRRTRNGNIIEAGAR